MNYVETVADLFQTRSGLAMLSVADYILLAEWEKEEIPLAVVMNSINKGFDKAENLADVNSIGHFQEIIRASFAKSLQAQIGT